MYLIFEKWIFGMAAIYGWMHCDRFSLDGKMHPARLVSPSRQFHHFGILFVHLEKISHKTLVEDFQKNLQLEKKLARSHLSRNWKKQNSHCWLFSFPPFQGWQREMGFEIRFGKYISELRGNLFDSSSGETHYVQRLHNRGIGSLSTMNGEPTKGYPVNLTVIQLLWSCGSYPA